MNKLYLLFALSLTVKGDEEYGTCREMGMECEDCATAFAEKSAMYSLDQMVPADYYVAAALISAYDYYGGSVSSCDQFTTLGYLTLLTLKCQEVVADDYETCLTVRDCPF